MGHNCLTEDGKREFEKRLMMIRTWALGYRKKDMRYILEKLVELQLQLCSEYYCNYDFK